jgi:hypothetical protein
LAGSFILNVLEVGPSPTATFYLLPSRLWELAIGGLASYIMLHKENTFKNFSSSKYFKLTPDFVSIVGAGLIWAGVRFIDKTEPFPGWWAVLPVLGTTLIIFSGPTGWVNRKILSRPLLIFVGIISYPLYLWHWPLLSFGRILGLAEPSMLVKFLIILLSFGFSWITYKYIETPIRKSSTRILKLASPLFALIFLMAGVGIISFIASMSWLPQTNFQKISRDFEFGYSPNRTELSPKYARLFREECNLSYVEIRSQEIDPTCYVPQHNKTIFIWGDSHAQHLNPGLTDYFSKEDVSILQITSPSCPPQIPFPTNRVCDRSNQLALKKIADLRPDVVILSEQGHILDMGRLKAAIETLHSLGIKNIVLVGPNPEWMPELYKITLRKFIYFHSELPQRLFFGLTEEPFQVEKTLKAEYGDDKQVKYLSLIDHLCDHDGCLTRVGNSLPQDLLLFDSGHFTENGSKRITNSYMGPIIKKMLSL